MLDRYRLTSAIIAALLQTGCLAPHKLLDLFIRHLSGVSPTDAPESAHREPDLPRQAIREIESLQWINLHRMIERTCFGSLSPTVELCSLIDKDWGHRMQKAVAQWFLRQQPITFEENQSEWVELGFARFLSGEERCVMDEPLVMMTAAKQLLDLDGFKLSSREAIDDQNHAIAGYRYETFLAVYLLSAFGESTSLEDVFVFPNPPPEWAKKKGVELVAYTSRNGEQGWCAVHWGASPQAGPTTSLGKAAISAKEVAEWFERPSTPLLFPDSSMGPDIVCFLRVPGKGILCMVLQAKFKGEALPSRKVKLAAATTNPESFYLRSVSYSCRIVCPVSHSTSRTFLLQNGKHSELQYGMHRRHSRVP